MRKMSRIQRNEGRSKEAMHQLLRDPQGTPPAGDLPYTERIGRRTGPKADHGRKASPTPLPPDQP